VVQNRILRNILINIMIPEKFFIKSQDGNGIMNLLLIFC
jgi:hypothetical protein